jgi:predicted TIM-barrel fold metal-dependent hydrolase
LDTRIFDEPKIDCHVHVLDPTHFPYRADTHYAPMGQEIGTPAQLARVMDAYGTRHALLVGPNSGYGLDNACMLDTIARGAGRYKGIAVAANDATLDELLANSGVRILIDHSGRPTVDDGLDQPGFRALLKLGATRRAFVKLSGFVKFSRKPALYDDTWSFVAALIDAFTLDHCLWASDWPYLRAPVHVDYGVLLHLALTLFPDASDRRKLLWDTPRELFGFAWPRQGRSTQKSRTQIRKSRGG